LAKAVKISEQVELIINKGIDKVITRSKLITATNAAANEAINIIRERANQGIDLNGKRFPKLSEKEPFQYSYGFQKRTNLSKLLRGKRTTAFQAVKAPNHMRLTGQMFSAMKFALSGVKMSAREIIGSFLLTLKSDQTKKIKWLAATTGATRGWGGRGKKTVYSKPSRVWFGICTSAARRKKELDRIKKVFLSKLGLSTGTARVK